VNQHYKVEQQAALAALIALDLHRIRLLLPPYVIGQAIIFLPCVFYLSSFLSSFISPRLISAAADWMSTILLYMVWP